MKKAILFILAICASSFVLAQSNTAVTYSIGIPSGDLADFITKASFRGIQFDYRKLVQPNIGVGFSVGWNVFYQEMDRATYTLDNQSLTGKQYRYSNNVPMYISPAYFLKPGETINPFVGLGIGTIYTKRNTDMNLYTLEQEAWNFALVPEIGMQYFIDDATSFHVSLKYNYGFAAGNELDNAQSYLSVNVGFAFIK